MEYTRLGNSGLEVSKICLGCMSFGEHGNSWKLNYEESRDIIHYAIQQGINFFDTANVYTQGKSEEYTGRALKEAFDSGLISRDEVVITTKVAMKMGKGPNMGGLSRKHILQELDHSLRRLGMDYVDLYVVHHINADDNLEELMETLNDCVRSGKVRYIGVSQVTAWQFQKCQYIAKEHGWAQFKAYQTGYSLLNRDAEFEHVPICKDWGIGFTPNSPYASGRLVRTGDTYRANYDGDRHVNPRVEAYDVKVIDAVAELAEKKGVTKAAIVLAWDFSKDFMTSPIIGATKIKYIDDALTALDVHLTREEIEELEKYCTPHRELNGML